MEYLAEFTDAFAIEKTVLGNDGATLKMRLRGFDFESHFLDDWEPVSPSEDLEHHFSLLHGELCGYMLKFDCPIGVMRDGKDDTGVLSVVLRVGPGSPDGRLNSESLQLALTLGDARYQGPETQGWFEYGMAALESVLQTSIFLKCCFRCALSAYHPAGQGCFGCLACFRGCKDERLAVTTNAELERLFRRRTAMVQETHYCPEFRLVESDRHRPVQ